MRSRSLLLKDLNCFSGSKLSKNNMHVMILFSHVFQVELQKGFLVCPETSRKFPVENGIPNMLLNEDEV